jgi:hypothetical protein
MKAQLIIESNGPLGGHIEINRGEVGVLRNMALYLEQHPTYKGRCIVALTIFNSLNGRIVGRWTEQEKN